MTPLYQGQRLSENHLKQIKRVKKPDLQIYFHQRKPAYYSCQFCASVHRQVRVLHSGRSFGMVSLQNPCPSRGIPVWHPAPPPLAERRVLLSAEEESVGTTDRICLQLQSLGWGCNIRLVVSRIAEKWWQKGRMRT